MLVSPFKTFVREHGIWWSNSFINKKDDFKVNNIQFHVLDYDKYIDTPEPIYNYHEQNLEIISLIIPINYITIKLFI